MTRPILEPEFWRERLAKAQQRGKLHEAVYLCPEEQWKKIEAKHREILAKHIGFADSVLDAGCGWGRLLTLMPKQWGGMYVGVDLSPDFIDLAVEKWGVTQERVFARADLRNLGWLWSGQLDWAVLISIRPMVKRELGDAVWEEMEKEIRRVAKRLLYLEYDPECEGFVE